MFAINMLIIYFITTISYLNGWSHYSLYNTDGEFSEFSRHCLYHAIHHRANVAERIYQTYQTIEYCLQSSSRETDNIVEGSISSTFTFDELRKAEVTTENLLKWSSPIDMVERYQDYLQTPNASAIDHYFNCTVLWFGPLCQYTFALDISFQKIVEMTYTSKNILDSKSENFIKFTCYIHLKCNRGPSPICLDWREVCDGKVDCLDGGEDEKHCFELETNQCAENEYQCRNGMCVNENFLLDGIGVAAKECLDGTDTANGERPTGLWTDLTFYYEDASCRSPLQFNCGDGLCLNWPAAQKKNCKTDRDLLFTFRALQHNQGTTPFMRCWNVLNCALIYDSMKCKQLCGLELDCINHVHQDCRIPLFYPDFPVWDSHVRSVYVFNQRQNNKDARFHPYIVCYQQERCPFLIPTVTIDNYTCRYTHELDLGPVNNPLSAFLPCVGFSQNKNETSCPDSLMLRCPNTNKCISKRRVMDGIADCYDAFDESPSANSCELNDKYRFQCTSETKCLSPILVGDGIKQCVGGEDEMQPERLAINIQEIPFSALCDGWKDIDTPENETDETHCEQWQCANQYTRCNKIWNCPKGIDEINCTEFFHCPSDHHLCISPVTHTMSCLHVDHADDGIVDCLGGTDEPSHCRRLYPKETIKRYRCWNNTKCTQIWERCGQCGKFDSSDQMCPASEAQIVNIIEFLEYTWDVWFYFKAPFSLQFLDNFPKTPSVSSTNKRQQHQPRLIDEVSSKSFDTRRLWLCNQGILVYVGKSGMERCFCPPNYYGDRCQYQNQRVSLTLRLRKRNVAIRDVIGLVIILVDHTGIVHSHDQLTYIPIKDCDTKFNLYLTYQNRTKDITKNYSVQVDAYNKVNLIYLASWTLPVQFLFMPVNRVSAELTIPSEQQERSRHHCRALCNHRYHIMFKKNPSNMCQCNYNRSDNIAPIQYECNCAPDSICAGMANNRSICVCSLKKRGPRCFLNSLCLSDTCKNGGLCISSDARGSEYQSNSIFNFTCLCPDGYSGDLCNESDSQIKISFVHVTIPQSLLVHFITLHKYDIERIDPMPLRVTTFKKIPVDQNTVTFFRSYPFNLLFAQDEQTYYLAVLQHNYTPSTVISTVITPGLRCPHIDELFDATTVAYPVLHRVKYYHIPCRKRLDLVCFHDNDTFMCLCTKERHANCFHFDFNVTYHCFDDNKCENGARCFQDHPKCPTKTMCVCEDCFYGSRCQFTTKGFGISLDMILGYYIQPHLAITRQSAPVKLSIALSTFILVAGLTNGILSTLTFQAKSLRGVGCSLYLLAASIISIFTVIILNLKVWFLILFQMNVNTSTSALLVNCISVEFILRSLVAITDWLYASVAVERVMTILLGVKFEKAKSKRAAKLLIIVIPFLTMASIIQDPIHRRLVDDEGEQRIWCVVRYTSMTGTINSVINIFHFITPFTLNLISAIIFIIISARTRSKLKKQQTKKKHFKEQFNRYKYLIISPIICVMLALPRLVISFMSGCMKSAKNPWLFLIGYFLSFIPSILTLIVFILPSETYTTEFKTTIKQQRKIFRRLVNRI